MKKATALIAVILIVCSLLCACNKTNESIFGTWSVTSDGAKMEYTFGSDGTGVISAMGGMMKVNFAYNLKDGEITFHELGDEVMGSNPYEYSINGDKLTLTRGDLVMELTKEK